PAIVFACGFPDPAFSERFRNMGAYISWARLLAASGMVAVTYSYRDPVGDLEALLRHLRENGRALGIDAERIALWAASGNVPTALFTLMRESRDAFRCAVLCYGLMLDSGDPKAVTETAAQFGFVVPCAGKSVDDLPPELPLFVVRAGRDAIPGINRSIDRFVA